MNDIIHDTSFLSELVLLRNDPDLINRVLPLAKVGNPHAQYAAGLIYAEGRGISENKIQAYYWLTLAIDQGDQDALLLREVLLNDMSDQDVAVAKLSLNKKTKS